MCILKYIYIYIYIYVYIHDLHPFSRSESFECSKTCNLAAIWHVAPGDLISTFGERLWQGCDRKASRPELVGLWQPEGITRASLAKVILGLLWSWEVKRSGLFFPAWHPILVNLWKVPSQQKPKTHRQNRTKSRYNKLARTTSPVWCWAFWWRRNKFCCAKQISSAFQCGTQWVSGRWISSHDQRAPPGSKMLNQCSNRAGLPARGGSKWEKWGGREGLCGTAATCHWRLWHWQAA